jgi:hypothetical protein
MMTDRCKVMMGLVALKPEGGYKRTAVCAVRKDEAPDKMQSYRLARVRRMETATCPVESAVVDASSGSIVRCSNRWVRFGVDCWDSARREAPSCGADTRIVGTLR